MDDEMVVLTPYKRLFDLMVIFGMLPILIPVMLFCALALLALEGRPVLYASERRVQGRTVMRIVKFRTMRRNADALYNRETVAVSTQRFLNLPPDSPMYTPVGRMIERCMFTELPQIWHVFLGKMSLVGNRPLPVNVVEALREVFPDVDRRFDAPAGLTGPVQLVGRDYISDSERLALECAYVAHVGHPSVVVLDLKILAFTVAAALSSRWRLNYAQAMDLVERHGHRPPVSGEVPPPRVPREGGGDPTRLSQ